MAQEKFQKIEFFTGELDRFASAADLVAAEVDFDITESIAVLLLRQRLRAPEHGFDTSEQFANGKRLGDVVVGAELEADYFVHFLATGSEHDDGNRGPLGFELFANVEAAHSRHHDVEDDQVGRNL